MYGSRTFKNIRYSLVVTPPDGKVKYFDLPTLDACAEQVREGDSITIYDREQGREFHRLPAPKVASRHLDSEEEMGG